MTLDEYMRNANEEYKNQQKENGEIDETAFNRSILLSIGDCEYTEKEFFDLLLVFISQKCGNEALNADRTHFMIESELHNRYLLTIEYRGNKPQIKEDFEVWLNLQTRELSAQKHISFGDCGEWVKVRDYRVLDGIYWYDLVEK